VSVSGHCPVCERLVGLSPTGERQGSRGTSQWWRVDLHSDGKGGLCAGGGRRV
jgi:hypothetical protein